MKRVVVGLGVLVFLTGCLQSLHPLFHEADLIFDERLVGAWTAEDETWTFERATSGMFDKRPENAFAIRVTDKDSTISHFQGHLGAIEDDTFMDLFPDGAVQGGTEGWCVPLHLVYRIWVGSDTLRIAALDTDWFDQTVSKEQTRTRLQIQKIDGRDIATAPTDTLQAFLRDHYRDVPNAYESVDLLVRKR